jgi:hypothetical protein
MHNTMPKFDHGRSHLSAPALGAVILALATTVHAAEAAPEGGLPLASIGIGLVLVVVVGAIFLAMRREKKPDASAFMTLEQITRLDSPDQSSTLMRVAHPKADGSIAATRARAKASWPKSPSDPYMSELEKQFPRIVEKIITMWPTADGEIYLQKLTIDERGDREGFSRDIIAEIMMLYSVKAKGHGDTWHS